MATLIHRRKPPERIDDLRKHACLRLRRSNGSIAPWPFVDGNRAVEVIVSGPLVAHDYPTLLGAAIEGVGLAQVPGPLAKAPVADGRLQALLTPFAATTPGVFLYYPDRRQVLPKLRAFIEHVKYRAGLREAERLRENCARSTLQTLDLEAALSSCLFTGPFLYYLASATPAAAAASARRFIKIPIHTTDPDRTRSCPHLMAGNGASEPFIAICG